MSNLEITPSPSPCSKFLGFEVSFDCVICGWNEESHDLENTTWYRSLEEVDMDLPPEYDT